MVHYYRWMKLNLNKFILDHYLDILFRMVTIHKKLNLTGREQISYGYESLRSQRFGTDTGALRMPQATRYLYTQPRTISLNVSWRF